MCFVNFPNDLTMRNENIIAVYFSFFFSARPGLFIYLNTFLSLATQAAVHTQTPIFCG